MKLYVKAARESNRLPYNYGYAGMKPTDYMDVEVLGETIGHQYVFYVQNPKGTWGYFWGRVPKNHLNLFGEWAMRVSKGPSYEASLNLDIDNLSDAEILNKVNSKLLSCINNPTAKLIADIFSVDLTKCNWRVFEDWVYITIVDTRPNSQVEGKLGLTIYSIGNNPQCHVSSALFKYMIENDIPIDDKLKQDGGYSEALKSIADQNKLKKRKLTPYPEGVTDNIAEAIHELYKFIVKQHLGYADTLEEAKDYVISKTIDYKRSARYGDKKVENQINELFDWAANNNITPQKLIKIANKVYSLYLDKQREI